MSDPHDGDEQPPVQASTHDPSGLDLARGIADAYRNSAARKPPRKRGAARKRPEQGAPGESDPTPLSSLVGRMIEENGWEEDLAVHRVFGDWARVVGPEVAQHCSVQSYVDGEIDIQADSTAWATQLRMLSPRIVAKLNAELGDGSVVRLNILAPQGPSWKSGRRSIRGARGPRDTYG